MRHRQLTEAMRDLADSQERLNKRFDGVEERLTTIETRLHKHETNHHGRWSKLKEHVPWSAVATIAGYALYAILSS